MSDLVVDASVAVKWVVPESHAPAALRALSPGYTLRAPDLIWAEVGNVLWKKCQRRELGAEIASQLLQDLRRFPIKTYGAQGLLDLAWTVAIRHHRTFYDGIYLALAASLNCALATADRRLYDALRTTPLAGHLLWVEDLA